MLYSVFALFYIIYEHHYLSNPSVRHVLHSIFRPLRQEKVINKIFGDRIGYLAQNKMQELKKIYSELNF